MPQYISPLLDKLNPTDVSNMPPRATACVECPSAVWMQNGRELKCLCLQLHATLWSNELQDSPQKCDGQMAALAKMEVAAAAKEK